VIVIAPIELLAPLTSRRTVALDEATIEPPTKTFPRPVSVTLI